MLQWLQKKISGYIVNYLRKPAWKYETFSVTSPKILEHYLKPGDVILVEGNLRISSVIKFLTQSTWSHAALYVGDSFSKVTPQDKSHPVRLNLIEAEADGGVKAVSLSKYRRFNTRICRPINLDDKAIEQVINYAIGRIGHQYDMKNVIDLARYLFPYPPVPVFMRRRMLAIGSGDPTRAICSTLIAQAFQTIDYPILPKITKHCINDGTASFIEKEIYHIRSYNLFTPRDFDLSPYFSVIKPTVESGFDYRSINWEHLQENQEIFPKLPPLK